MISTRRFQFLSNFALFSCSGSPKTKLESSISSSSALFDIRGPLAEDDFRPPGLRAGDGSIFIFNGKARFTARFLAPRKTLFRYISTLLRVNWYLREFTLQLAFLFRFAVSAIQFCHPALFFSRCTQAANTQQNG